MRSSPSNRSPARLALVLSLCLAPLALLRLDTSSAQDSNPDATAQTINLHQWGAVTLFHGLPSDRVRAIAQDSEGVMWFGTDAGLARYDGRRTQTVTEGGLAGRRVLALAFDAAGALWVGTDSGAFVRAPGRDYRRLAETEGRPVTSVNVVTRGEGSRAGDESSRVVLTSAGVVFDCRLRADGEPEVRKVEDKLLTSAGTPAARAGAQERAGAAAPNDDKQEPAPLELTGAAAVGDALLVASRGRGFLAIENGAVREVFSRPRPYFVEALAQDAAGQIWFGTQTAGEDSGLYTGAGLLERPSKVLGGATGTVTALRFDPRGDLFVGTDGEGVIRYRGRTRLERFTFAGTRGGLRSNRVYSVFFDREGVAWFGTDRGVCRYDPRGLRNELVAEDAQHNFVRVLFRTSQGRLLAGTNRGLFVREPTSATTAAWRAVETLEGRTVHAVAEDASGLLFVGTNAGLYTGISAARAPRPAPSEPAAEEPAPSPSPAASPATNEAARPAPNEAAPEKRPTPAAAAAPERATDDASEGKPPGEASKPPGDAERREAARRASEPAIAGNVRAVAAFGGATYIASYGRGLERVEKSEGRLRRTLVWPSASEADARQREVISLYAEPSGERLWVGTAAAGVFVYDGREVKTDPALDALRGAAVRSVSVGGGDSARAPLWFATARGLYLYRAGALTHAVANVDARAVVALAEESAAREPAATNETRALTTRVSYASETTNEKNEKGAAGTDAAQPGGATVRALCATAGGGLLRVAVGELFGVMVARLDVEQGLPSQSVHALLASRGEGPDAGEGDALWIGTTRGVSRYEPGGVPPALRASRITGARAHQPEELRSGLNLEYPQNSLVLDVEATSSRTFPEQFQYAFLLFDSQNRIIKRKLAHDSQFQLENLPPGDYRVEARAFTVDLVESRPLSFALKVARAPFPWTTAALSVLLLLAVIALAWGAVQNARERRAGRALLNANQQLAAARLQLANETEAERRRISRDLHDQTLADLRRLLLLTDQLTAGGNGDRAAETIDPAALRAEIESISGEVRRICEDLSPSVLENVGFAAALEFALAHAIAHLPADCRFTYEFACDDDLEERLRFSRAVQLQIYRIVQEAVSNVCRHAGATHVRLRVDVTDAGEFVLTLEDDGRGFDTENRKARRGRGLSNIRARASIIEAAVRWHKRDERGTVFTLQKTGADNGRDAAT